MKNMRELLMYARNEDCSDIHITAGMQVAVRRYKELYYLDDTPTITEAEDMIFSLVERSEDREEILAGIDVDLGVLMEDCGRLRVNVYHQRNNLAASIRLLQQDVPALDTLGLPGVIKEMAELPRGMVLITGPTGSGKTTTLASMLEYLNINYAKHIMTFEDPIEYILNHKKSLIHQREVGRDVTDFSTALRSSLREDPDIILVGEIRDYETLQAALSAAETGHLVLSTLHTASASQTIERLIDSCPSNVQNQVRLQLASMLKGVFSQVLVPRADGKGMVVATESLISTPAVSSMIRDNKVHMIDSAIQTGGKNGMHTLNADLIRLVREKKITRDVALKAAVNPGEMFKET
ncbi:MAG: PilT/PilU family type 4a pilus ATPase [Lachnospiraceae bacterium]|nr:PilT/PilU family type 4a pilus ATPase [Lachnospiraceae bacterium]